MPVDYIHLEIVTRFGYFNSSTEFGSPVWHFNCLISNIYPAMIIILPRSIFRYLTVSLSNFHISGWESSTTEMPWSSVTATTLVYVPSAASSCRSWTPRLVSPSPTVTSGWRRDTAVQVHN